MFTYCIRGYAGVCREDEEATERGEGEQEEEGDGEVRAAFDPVFSDQSEIERAVRDATSTSVSECAATHLVCHPSH